MSELSQIELTPDEKISPEIINHSATLGARYIFRRFVMISVVLQTLIASAVIVYDIVDSVLLTHEYLRQTGDQWAFSIRQLRSLNNSSDVETIKQAAQILQIPLALINHNGQIEQTTSPLVKEFYPRLFPFRPNHTDEKIEISAELGEVSGGWFIRPFSSEHNLLIIVGHTPDREGHYTYLTRAAGVIALGLLASFLIMFIAANWMLRHPLHRLVDKLTNALINDGKRRQEAEVHAIKMSLEAQQHLAFLNHLINASPEIGIIATDEHLTIQIVNRAAESILGINPRKIIGQLTFPELREKHLPKAQSSSPHDFTILHAEEGEEFWLDATGKQHLLRIQRSPILDSHGAQHGLVATFLDVTKRKKLEAELQLNEMKLIQSAKMATLGEMAAGVAHELNQPLNNISLLSSRLMRFMEKAPLSDEEQALWKDKLEKIDGQTSRATRIIDQLRTFSRPQAKKIGTIKLADTIDGVLNLLREQLREHQIDLQVNVPADLPLVMADEPQLEQVLMNLLVNARDALDEIAPTENREKKIEIIGRPGRKGPNSEIVELLVKDNGPGIPLEQQQRIFEPFFTTKSVGKGTGLGLSISYGLIHELGGDLTVESTPGEGAAFCIKLRKASSI